MKHVMHQILGRRIVAVLIGNGYGERRPRAQLRLVFEDGASLEFYSGEGQLSTAGGLDREDIATLERRIRGSCDYLHSVILDPDNPNVAVEHCEYEDNSVRDEVHALVG